MDLLVRGAGMKRFVGFGFGPIQSGLMLYEAQKSGNFDSFVVAEVDQVLVDAVRGHGDRVAVNVARKNRIDVEMLEGVVLLNPGVAEDRARLVEEVAAADEMATAIPSVDLYMAGGPNSIVSLLAEALGPDKPRILYASENNNYAAEVLQEKLLKVTDESHLSTFQILNTVIGKMSGVIRDGGLMKQLALTPMAPGFDRAVLVEEFNRILVSKVALPGMVKGITPFVEKDELLPFEEAKLFGHNAIHSMLGYLGAKKGYQAMSEIRNDDALYALGYRAFMDECGSTMISKHGEVGDPLFTPDGWREYVEDLLVRMTNPFLHDAVERICRDPQRKLGYNDRLFGTMRECLKQDVRPRLLASGAKAGVEYLMREDGSMGSDLTSVLAALWEGEADDGFMGTCVELVEA